MPVPEFFVSDIVQSHWLNWNLCMFFMEYCGYLRTI